MSSWSEVSAQLLRLQDQEPPVLVSYPTPDADPEPQPPFAIRLAATALEAAEELRRLFGDEVKLQVGALPYPPRPLEEWERPTLRAPLAVDHHLEGIRVELDGPLEVESGETTRHALLISNDTDSELTVRTNGYLTAVIVDLRDGSQVGGSSGFQHQPLVRYKVAPHATTRIPLHVGTSSYVAALGYTIPPGPWGLTVDLDLGGKQPLRSPVLAFDIFE